jgi:hypothetical protein
MAVVPSSRRCFLAGATALGAGWWPRGGQRPPSRRRPDHSSRARSSSATPTSPGPASPTMELTWPTSRPWMASGILFLGGGEGGQRGTPAQLPITFRQQAPYRAFCEAAPRVKLELSFRDPHAAVGLYLSLLPSSSTWWRSVSRVRSSFCSRCSRTRRCPSAHEGRRGVVGRAIYAPALILRPRRDTRCHHIVTLRGTSHRCSHRQ